MKKTEAYNTDTTIGPVCGSSSTTNTNSKAKYYIVTTCLYSRFAFCSVAIRNNVGVQGEGNAGQELWGLLSFCAVNCALQCSRLNRTA